VCGNRELDLVWDFGPSPLANSFKEKPETPEMFYPLTVYMCAICKNVQSGYVVPADILFKKYLYASSTSKVFRKHFVDFARDYGPVKKVVDIGSNDGILLKPFQFMGAEVIGVDPAKNLHSGVPTIREYFTKKIAQQIGHADLVTCTNTFAHIDNLDEVMRGVKVLIGKTGTFMVEVQYLIDQLKNLYFDNVYHEHLQFWSVTALSKFVEKHGLFISNVEHIPTHGGSIRVYIKYQGTQEPVVEDFLVAEEKVLNYYELQDFGRRVMENKVGLLNLLYGLKRQGKTIIGYGAPAKSTTLCNYFGIGKEVLDYIVDDSPLKQGRFSPGKDIPVVSGIRGVPDYILILAWNFAESIMINHPGYKYIIPVPKPRII
jgi:hypothetical protein